MKYLRNSWSVVKIGTTDSQRKLFYLLNREKERLRRSGVVPSTEVLAHNLQANAREIEDMEQRLYYGDVSLEEPQYEDGVSLMDTIESDEDIEDAVIEKEYRERLLKLLGIFRMRLNAKERFIFDHRFMAETSLTLAEIGEHFKTSKEAVRQMETRIWKKLTIVLTPSRIGLSRQSA
jgi:RNA polymerase sigma-32 factor